DIFGIKCCDYLTSSNSIADATNNVYLKGSYFVNEKYWNPALERADKVLNLIAENPSKYRLIDISKKLEINKSTLFILINTMEKLGWITKHIGDVYSLGGTMGSLGAAYLKQFNLLHAFYEEAAEVQMKVKENLQLGILDGGDVIYLGK
ncbi:hypothetical protein RhiirA1_405677, partial [Rhizophagus irregularis]